MYNIRNLLTSQTIIRRSIKRFIIHPNYNAKLTDGDIALVELRTPVDLDQSEGISIAPVCLPHEEDDNDFAGRIGVVTGWGYTKFAQKLKGSFFLLTYQ